MFALYDPWKHQKTSGCSRFQEYKMGAFSKYSNFSSDFFDTAEKRLDKKAKVNFKFMMSQTR